MKFITFMMLFAVSRVFAFDVQPGAGTTVLRGMAPVADITLTEGSRWFAQQSLTYVGASRFGNDAAAPNEIARALLGYKLWRMEFAAGGSYMLDPWPYNGGRWNFNLQATLRLGKLGVTYTHFSDAGFTKSNIGRDMVLLGWRF